MRLPPEILAIIHAYRRDMESLERFHHFLDTVFTNLLAALRLR